MKMRRMAYWWFRFVVSGRFLEKFLNLRRERNSKQLAANACDNEASVPSADRNPSL